MPPVLEVSGGGSTFAKHEIPQQDDSQRRPVIVPLDEIRSGSDGEVEIAVSVTPGSEEVPIVWSSLSIAEQHPALYRIF